MTLHACKTCKGDGFIADAPCGCREAFCPHTPLFDPSEPHAGLYQKFWVRRTDGSSGEGGKHAKCDYLVLDWRHDKFAIHAALAYADACEAEYPELARDLRALAKETKR